MLYLDTSIERWGAEKATSDLLYARRRKVMSRKRDLHSGPTSLVCCGANLGLISHIAKQAVLDIAEKITDEIPPTPSTQKEWALLVKKLGISTMHIAEYL